MMLLDPVLKCCLPGGGRTQKKRHPRGAPSILGKRHAQCRVQRHHGIGDNASAHSASKSRWWTVMPACRHRNGERSSACRTARAAQYAAAIGSSATTEQEMRRRSAGRPGHTRQRQRIQASKAFGGPRAPWAGHALVARGTICAAGRRSVACNSKGSTSNTSTKGSKLAASTQ